MGAARPEPTPVPLEGIAWQEILGRSEIAGDQHNYLEVASEQPWSHLRFHIYPDGGVARLRVFGTVYRDWSTERVTGGVVDLVSLPNGGRVIECSDSHYGLPHRLLMPGRGINMGDGWETRRRRGPGHDWVVLALACRGSIERVEVDTAHFKGNYPDRCSLEGIDAVRYSRSPAPRRQSPSQGASNWTQLLSEQKLQADSVHSFDQMAEKTAVRIVRLNIFPDGGVSRLRLWGRPC